ncbi:integrase core domain-containing protein [Burkholderia sp. LMG 32019]|uniref:integrase core domain-containing protein n=1 Tax=Burkholderia sp. LMG 32019 TaxID=3158173 RepID=UPI003C2C4851
MQNNGSISPPYSMRWDLTCDVSCSHLASEFFEAKVLIERCRQFYNERRPHSAHRYQPPATVRRAWLDCAHTDARLTA